MSRRSRLFDIPGREETARREAVVKEVDEGSVQLDVPPESGHDVSPRGELAAILGLPHSSAGADDAPVEVLEDALDGVIIILLLP